MRRLPVLLLLTICFLTVPTAVGAAPPAPPDLYLSPSPAARHISPATSLAIREGDPFDLSLLRQDMISVTGSHSGPHPGVVVLSDDHLTLLFYPDQPFDYDETVTVSIDGVTTARGNPIPSTRYQFHTLQRSVDDVTLPPVYAEFGRPSPYTTDAALYVTHPEFTSVMPITVTSPAAGVDDGFLFMTGLTYQSMLMVDDHGEPLFIKEVPDGLTVTDFKRQDVDGTPYLSYHQGLSSNLGWSDGVFHVMDESYNVVDTWTIGNGYGADLHEFLLLDNGHALMASYSPVPADLRPFGGPADGIVIDAVIQEQDSDKNVVFEWHATQHIPLTDSLEDLSASPVDYVHINAIDVDNDGNLLVSNRNTNSVIKISRQTGQVMWIMGGRRNQFRFTNDTGFSRQHDIRRLPGGHMTLFDNGNDRFPPRSRAVEYAVNEVLRLATRVWQYPEGDSHFAPYMGNVQRLNNGNTLIGWGAVPGATEVRPDSSRALELELGGSPYRVFRFPWNGAPAELPRAAVAEAGGNGHVNVYASWNGATNIDEYEVYAGTTSQEMSLLSTVDRSGFETAVTFAGLPDDLCAFKVRPVRHNGQPTPYSNVAYRLDRPECHALVKWQFLPLVQH